MKVHRETDRHWTAEGEWDAVAVTIPSVQEKYIIKQQLTDTAVQVIMGKLHLGNQKFI